MEIDKDDILRNISLSGSASEENVTLKQIIAKPDTAAKLLNLTSGLPRIAYHQIGKFTLILTSPAILRVLNPFEIRCCLCSRVISYPCWYWNEKFNVNWFHYFVCFDERSPNKVTARCYRR